MHVCDHSPQRVLELPRTRPESGHAISPRQLHYERGAASAAILAAAALALATAVAARLSLVADNAAARAVSTPSTAESAPLRVSGGMLFSVMHAAVSFGKA